MIYLLKMKKIEFMSKYTGGDISNRYKKLQEPFREEIKNECFK